MVVLIQRFFEQQLPFRSIYVGGACQIPIQTLTIVEENTAMAPDQKDRETPGCGLLWERLVVKLSGGGVHSLVIPCVTPEALLRAREHWYILPLGV